MDFFKSLALLALLAPQKVWHLPKIWDDRQKVPKVPLTTPLNSLQTGNVQHKVPALLSYIIPLGANTKRVNTKPVLNRLLTVFMGPNKETLLDNI